MKKYKALICVTLILALLGVGFAVSTLATSGSWADYAESDAWYQNYSDAPTYDINSAARLASLAKLVNSGISFEGRVIEISENIDLGAHYWVAVGNEENPFKGTVVGNLKTISGMHINTLNGTCAGLFGYVQGPGEIANLTVTGSISIVQSGNIGGAVGIASDDAKITAIQTDVDISVSGSDASDVGGILGLSNGTDLKYCSARGTINVTNASTVSVGGVVGEIAADTEIGGDKSSQTQYRGALNITAGTANAGGIIGSVASGVEIINESADASTEYVWSLGAITVNASELANVGGFIGNLEGIANLDNAKFANSITVGGDGPANVGGIIGAQQGSDKSTLSNCFFTTGFSVKNKNDQEILQVQEEDRAITVNASGTVYTGGIYGNAETLEVISPTVGAASHDSGKTVSIISAGTVGGIGGNSMDNATVNDNINITELTVKGIGENAVIGGIFGNDSGAGVLNVSADKISISADGASNTVGGVIGELNCEKQIRFTGTIEVTGAASSDNVTLGGIVGGGTGKLEQSDITGEITVRAESAAKDVGGIAGTISGGINALTVHDKVTVSCGSTATHIGGIAGASEGAVSGITAEKPVCVTADGDAESIGGIIGSAAGTMDGITAEDTITVEAGGNATDIGGVAGTSTGEINNITLKKDISVTVDGESANAGGVVGTASGAINGISADEAVTIEANKNTTNLGGVIGKSAGNIEAVTLNEVVSVNGAENAENAGGVIGSVSGSTSNVILKKDISVTVAGESTNAGGIIGRADGIVSTVTAEGNVTVQANGTTSNLGGTAGLASGGIDTLEIKGRVDVTANDESENVGGVAGQLGGKLDGCTIDGDTEVIAQKTTVCVGGAVGKITASGLIGSAEGKKLTLKGAVTVTSADPAVNVGGVVGNADGAVNYVYIDIPVTVTANDEIINLGGIIGNTSANVNGINADGSVTVTAKKAVTNLGGMIGSIGGDADTITLNDAVNVIANAQTENFGGVIGKAGKNVKNITVNNDITVTAEAVDEYGGVIGLAHSDVGTIDTLTVVGNISVTADEDVTDIGGVVGNTAKSFTDLNVTGNITVLPKSKSVNAAGAVGKITGNLSDVKVSGIISVLCSEATENAAGLVGNAVGNITNITVTATETELANNSNITVACSDTSSNASGVAAKAAGNVTDVEVTGKIEVTCAKVVENIGGAAGSITGNLTNITLKDKVNVSANGESINVGGVAGLVSGNANTVNTKELEVICKENTADLGGVFGRVNAEIKTAYINGKIIVTCKDTVENIGGVAGFVGNRMIDVKINDKTTVNAEADATNIGGVAGLIAAGGIDSLEVNGKITVKCASACENAGGVVGKVNGAMTGITVESDLGITITGAVKNIGSFAGLANGSLDMFSLKGNISVKCENIADNVGGLIGKITGDIGKSDVSGLLITGDIGVYLTGGKRPENDTTPVNVGGILGNIQGSAYNVTVNGNNTLSAKDAAPVTNIGGVAGLMAGDIDKLNITGNSGVTMNNTAENSGGIIGNLSGDLTNVTISGNTTVTAKSIVANTGGLTGIHGGNLGELRYTGAISVRCNTNADYAGGLSGVYNGIMSAIHTSGSINVRCAGDETYAGGIAGSFEGSANGIENDQNVFNILGELTVTLSGEGSNFATGNYMGNYTAGAFAGINKGNIENISLGDAVSLNVNSRNATIGGFAGVNDGVIKYAYTTADIKLTVSSAATLGGLVGLNNGTVQHSSRDIDVTLNVNGEGILDSFAGGLIGQNTGKVEKSFTDCDVHLNGSSIICGGLIGNMTGGLVSNSYTGDRTITGGKMTGGLIGSFSDGKVEYCYSAMKVNGADISGGIFGEYLPNTVDEHVLLCRFLSDGINYNMLPAGKGGEGILDQSIKYIRALSGVQLQDGRAENVFFNYYDFDESKLLSWDFENVWQFVISDGAKYIYPSLVIDADKVILNYDIRWYTDNPGADTFTLSNEADLSGFAMILNGKFEEYPNIDFEGKTILVSKNINIQRSNWEPIENFKGTFNGQSKLINGLRVSNIENAGLFGTILPEATIVDLTIEADKVTGINTAGVIAGVNNGKISGAVVTVKDRISAPDAGSAVGVNNGVITDTAANIVGTVYGIKNAGGIAGTNSANINKPTVTVKGSVKADVNAGGIAGDSSGGIVEPAVTVTGMVNGASAAGGISGVDSGSITAPVCTVASDANIYSDTDAGGIVADNTGVISTPEVILNGRIEAVNAGGIACRSTTNISNGKISGTGVVSGSAYAGGIVSRSKDISITDSTVTGITVSGKELVGGVAGEVNTWSVDNITIDGAVLRSEDPGATLGAISGRTTPDTSDIVFNGTIRAAFDGEAKNAGGIIGNTSGVITKLTFGGSIDAELNGKTENAGGIIGLASGELGGVTVTGNTHVNAKASVRNLGGVAGHALRDVSNTVVGSNITVTSASDTENIGALSGNIAGDLIATQINGNTKVEALSTFTNLGGVIGLLQGDLNKLHYKGEIAVSNVDAGVYAGGLAGRHEGVMSGVHTSGRIALNSRSHVDGIGGIVGYFKGAANGIADKNNDINILGELKVELTGGTAGAFAGVNDGVIKNISLGDNVGIAVNAATATVGGFAGKNSGTLDFVYSTADINCKAENNAVLGGLVGENSGIIKRSGRDIAVALDGGASSESSVGGLIGNMLDGSVIKCFADCEVRGAGENANKGGLIGKASAGSVTDCYASNKAGEQAGDLIGKNEGATVVNSYCAMKLPESFEGYDFENGWQKTATEGAKYVHPSLILTADDRSVILNYDLRWYTKNADAAEFTLEDEEDLAGFAMILNGRFEEFTGVDFAGRNVIVSSPINLEFGSWEPVRNFKGTFEGGKNLINGLRVTATDTEPAPDSAGLFDAVPEQAKINDLYIEACSVDGTVTAGAAAGINNGTLLNPVVSLKGAINASDAGAVTGNNNGVITNPVVYIDGIINADENAGGVAGRNNADITTPTVTVNGRIYSSVNAGGIVAENKGSITKPTIIFNGGIEALNAGVIVCSSTTDLTDCRVSGSGAVFGTNRAGGVISAMNGIRVSDCAVDGITIKGLADIGGVAGEITGGLVENAEVKNVKIEAGDGEVCVGGVAGRIAVAENADRLWNGRAGVYQGVYKSKVAGLSVTSAGAEKSGTHNAAIGGIAGAINIGSVYECESEGEISASGYKDLAVGGAIGSSEKAYVVGNTASVGITAHYAQTYSIGGFIGKLFNSTVRFNKANSDKMIDIAYEDASVPVKGMYAGGFVGQADSTTDWMISDNTADQDVRAVSLFTQNGNVGAGGFAGQIGYNEAETKISRCYALGDAYGDSKAYAYSGGFVGEFYKGTIELSYASGNAVTAISPTGAYAGGFAGRLMNEPTYINDCYAADGKIYARAEGANAYADAFYGNKIGTVTGVYGSAKSVIQAPMGSEVVRDNEFILPEQNNPLNAGIKLDGFDFEGMTWLYIDGINEGRPVLSVFEGSGFMPDMDWIRSQNLSKITVANAAEFASATRYLNDRSIALLFTDGRASVSGTDITMTDNIDLSAVVWLPIKELGNGETLDGGNHTLSGLVFDGEHAEFYGLVSKNNGTIKNLIIAGSSVTAADNAALVAGSNAGSIENITIASDTSVRSNGCAGAVAGTNDGSVTGVNTSATVKGYTAGGVAGLNNGVISNAETTSKVSAAEMKENQSSGGIVGINDGTLTGIKSYAEVSGYYAGGIAGVNGNAKAGTIKSASSDADVSSDYAAGGIVGYNYKGTVGADDYGNVRSNASVRSENSYAGGIAGINSSAGTIAYSDSLLNGTIEGKYTGGITGSGNYDEITCRYEQCPSPRVDTEKRSFTDAITVKLITELEGASIYYTLDGSDPTAGSTLFDPDHPITLTASTTIKAIVINSNKFVSDIATFAFSKTGSSGGGGGGGGGTSVSVPYISTTVLTGEEAEKRFTEKQKQAVGNMDTDIPVSVVLNSGVTGSTGSYGEDVTVKVPFDTENGKNPDAIAVYRISDDGVRKIVKHTYENGEVSFSANYSSEFVITWCPVKLYKDLDEDAWYHDGIHYAIEHNIMQGVDNGLFMPNSNVTRAMVAQVLYNMENKPECDYKINYLDVAEKAWYYDAIRWATSEGIIEGYGNGKYGPEDNLNREQLVTVMYRYAKLKGEGFSGVWMFNLDYPDKADVSGWADEAMHWMVMNGVIYGIDGKIVPQGNASRAMIATVLMRFETFIQK